ncbi:allergen Tha p 1 [Galleria mellonella]|uniref:Allergen Tha p 1-like n=1 Tax=Galleria mellonella TaxID=7137 RepID=A0A5C0E2H9_GALME|nr:allergen Tha p 1 [Galleria mellonella]QEI46801.1 chemosensory protein 3 [Galleria mellonella]
MKSATALLVLTIAAFAAAQNEQYTDKFDNVNLDEILSNKRLLVPYIKCALDQGKCTADGKELKSHIKEALENYCAKCTEAQKDGTRRVIGHLINNEPQYWEELTNKYDKDRKYVEKYESELKTIQG